MSGARREAQFQWGDAAILEALALRDADGRTAGEIARAFGCSRSGVLGLFKRIRDAEAPGAAGDGTLPARWWRAGLARRSDGEAA